MKSPIIVALDYPELDMATGMLDRLDPDMTRVKVGKEMFTRAGPAFVEKVTAQGFQVFLDLKYHDIPNTVRGAARAATELGVTMFNVHAAGGRAMMTAALEGVREAAPDPEFAPKVIAVTVLTSIDGEILNRECGVPGTVEDQVLTKVFAEPHGSPRPWS